MKVQLLAHSVLHLPVLIDVGMAPDLSAEDADIIAEFAGRACYQSFHKPNPETRANADYLQHILQEGHFSILEHASVAFYVTGVSRSLTHELIRHRHLGYSQLSQRFVDPTVKGTGMVTPPLLEGEGGAAHLLNQAWEQSIEAYEALLKRIDAAFPDATRKQKREAARAVLPGGVETRIVVSGNLRAWRDVLTKRYHVAADAEIAQFAALVLAHLREIAPSAVQDLPDEPFGTS